MATYTTNHDFINGEIIPALGDHAGDHDIDGIWTELRDRGMVVYSNQRDGFEWADGLGEDSFWDVVQNHIVA